MQNMDTKVLHRLVMFLFFFFESVRMSCFGKQLTSTQSNLKVMTAV